MSVSVAQPQLRSRVVGALILTTIAVIGLSWAKWLPYATKIDGLRLSHQWSGGAMFATAGQNPSLSGAWDFTVAYSTAVWKALVVSLLVAAAIDALVSRRWLVRLLSRGGRWRQAGTGATLALPSMMCTCCTAPVTVTLRRAGAPIAAVVAHWLGNPLLNPAVLVFLFLVGPWQWGATRVVMGIAVVLVTAVVTAAISPAGAPSGVAVASEEEPSPRLSDLSGRFLRSLWRISRVLVPEYAAVVLVVGGLSGWLSRFTELTGVGGLMTLLIAAVLGTLLVIPTGGEIPVMIGLSAAGASAGLLGVLLITLPALSLPSMVMVLRSLSMRVMVVAALTVAGGGLVSAGLLHVLS